MRPEDLKISHEGTKTRKHEEKPQETLFLIS